MEAFKTTCHDCGHVRFWIGYKTGLGKSADQLEQMRRNEHTCRQCHSQNATTDLDRETEAGRTFDEMNEQAARLIVNTLTGR